MTDTGAEGPKHSSRSNDGVALGRVGNAPKPPRRSRLTLFLLVPLGILVLLLGGTAFLLFAPAGESFRKALAEEALESSLGHDVRVIGEFGIEIGSDLKITFNDLTLQNPQWPSNPDMMRVRRGNVVVRLWPLIGGRLIVRRLDLHDAGFAFETAADGRNNWTLEGATRAPDRRGRLADIPIVEEVSVSETVASFRNQRDGWDFEMQVAELATKRSSDGLKVAVDGHGLVNGKPITVAGSISPLGDKASAIAPRSFQVNLTGPALDARVEGRAGTWNGEGLDFKVTSRTTSLGQLLELLQVERALEGDGSLSAHFVEDRGTLSISRFEAGVTMESGQTVNVEGAIADVLEGTGLDIDFTTRLAQEDDGASSALHDIRLLGISGQLGGSLDAVLLKRLTLSTNAIDRELREIGTLSVQTLRKDARGRIGTTGLRALSGSPEDPALDITGSIGDVLRLKEIALSGRFQFASTTALGLEAGDATARLGRLQGQFSLSDKDGTLAVDKLSAAVTDTDLFALSLTSAEAASGQPDKFAFDVSLQVPRYNDLAAVLGAPARNVGAFAFVGKIGGGDQRVRAAGTATLDETAISGDFLGDFSGERAVVTGTLSSPLLRLTDAVALLSATSEPGSPPPPRAAAARPEKGSDQASFTAKLLNGFDGEVEIDVKKIAGDKDSASNLAGRIKLQDGIVTLEGLRAVYLGGKIRADGTMDARARPTKLKLKASMDHWPLGAVLQKLESDVPATGDLYLNVDLAAAGDTRDAILSTAEGSFEAALTRGKVKSGLLALTGLDLTSWLISAPTVKGFTDVGCFIARFAVKQQIATARALIFDTPDVLLSGSGKIDLGKQTLNIDVVPQPKKRRLVQIVTPFSITGPLASPKVTISPAGAVARGTSEVLLLPANLLGTLVGLFAGGGAGEGNPCIKQ